MGLSFEQVNPVNADAEILDDYYTVHRLDTRTDADQLNKILKKYGYPDVSDNTQLYENKEDFKQKIDSDESLTWRRVKMMDVGLLDGILEKLEKRG